MGEINSYRDMIVWQQAVELATAVYAETKSWPRDEIYGLTAQARRSAVSVAANIAEGFGRENKGSYIQFLRIAQGSLKETETHLTIAQRVGIAGDRDLRAIFSLAEDVGKMLRGLIRKLGEQ